MNRPLNASKVDLSLPQDLTAGMIERLRCPPDKTQAFLRDRKSPSLRVRVTTSGAKAFVFEAKLGRQTIRRTIGDVRTWSIDAARTEANRQRVLIDGGADPRELEKEATAARLKKAKSDTARSVIVESVWAEYLDARRPRWGDLHYRDHLAKAKRGGTPSATGTRGKLQTVNGPLYPLMQLKLSELTPEVLSNWATKETSTRPTATRLSWRLLRGFLSWCSEHPQYAQIVPAQNPAKAKVVREVLGKPKVKHDALQKEQLTVWFASVRQLPNLTVSTYLQVLLLTGARPGEILSLRWKDVNKKWKGLTIRDKVEGERIIPLTPYAAHIIDCLPRINDWVFASPSRMPKMDKEHMTNPNHQHDRACKVAGIEGLTLHGLRRSFKSLTEWLEIPAGVVAQLMGHKPSATAEKHYTVRPLDLLRVHHERIEAWILEQGNVTFERSQRRATLRAIK